MKTALILKKVATVVALVVAGLLAAPLEKAEAQTGIPEVTHFFLFANEASDYELTHGWWGATADLDTSSAGVEWDEVTETLSEDRGNPPTLYDGYFKLRITPRSDEGKGDCIDVFFYVDRSGNRASVSAWVEDSEGNYYTVDVTVISL